MELERTGFSLEDRILCSDESCIGVVGPDGLCKECGRRYEGAEPLPGAAGGARAPDRSEAPVPGAGAGAPLTDAEARWDPDERVPCPDEACVGILGRDGRCGTCGRSA